MNAQLAERDSSPVSLGDWIITLIVLLVLPRVKKAQLV